MGNRYEQGRGKDPRNWIRGQDFLLSSDPSGWKPLSMSWGSEGGHPFWASPASLHSCSQGRSSEAKEGSRGLASPLTLYMEGSWEEQEFHLEWRATYPPRPGVESTLASHGVEKMEVGAS